VMMEKREKLRVCVYPATALSALSNSLFYSIVPMSLSVDVSPFSEVVHAGSKTPNAVLHQWKTLGYDRQD
jgi:hypothetical protein